MALCPSPIKGPKTILNTSVKSWDIPRVEGGGHVKFALGLVTSQCLCCAN